MSAEARSTRRHSRCRLLLAFLGVTVTAVLGAAAAGADQRPNILFAVADDWSYGNAGAYECRWVKTPAFDRVAKDGVLFTHAYTPNAKCAPSRSCILTGRNSWQLKAACNHYCFFPPEFKTFPEALKEDGYFVGVTGKGWGPGVATNASGQPREMTGHRFDDQKAVPPAKGIAANDYAGNFADFLKATPKGAPWCFWYGSHEPHRRYEYGSGVAKGGKSLADVDRIPGYWPDTEVVRNDLLDYAFEVEHFDRHLQRMLEMLEASGAISNTIVVVTSDNGMPFPRTKSQEYQDSNHLPLAVMWPQGIRKGGRVVDDYVSFIDFAPSVLEWSGLRWEKSGMAPITGRSIAGILASERSGRVDPARDHVLIGKERHDVGRPDDQGYPIRGIVKNDLLYLENFEPLRWPGGNPETGYLTCDASPTKTLILKEHRRNPGDTNWALCFGKRPAKELYDLRKDPDCMVNLAGRPEQKSVETSLQRELMSELKAQDDPRMSGQGGIFEKFPYSDPEYRNFYNRYMAGEKKVPIWVNASDFEVPREAK